MRLALRTWVRKMMACLIFIMMIGSVQSSLAASMACPVMLYGGRLDHGAVTLSFMNRGKVPIRRLGLSCVSVEGHKATHFACQAEEGVFFPGTPYSLRFDDPDKASRLVEVSVKNAVFGGTLWTSTRDQPCRPLKILKR